MFIDSAGKGVVIAERSITLTSGCSGVRHPHHLVIFTYRLDPCKADCWTCENFTILVNQKYTFLLFEVGAVPDIFYKPGLGRVPSQPLLCLLARCRPVDGNEVGEPRKMSRSLLRRFAHNGYVQALTYSLCNEAELHPLLGNAVEAGTRRTMLNCQTEQACGIEGGALRASG